MTRKRRPQGDVSHAIAVTYLPSVCLRDSLMHRRNAVCTSRGLVALALSWRMPRSVALVLLGAASDRRSAVCCGSWLDPPHHAYAALPMRAETEAATSVCVSQRCNRTGHICAGMCILATARHRARAHRLVSLRVRCCCPRGFAGSVRPLVSAHRRDSRAVCSRRTSGHFRGSLSTRKNRQSTA